MKKNMFNHAVCVATACIGLLATTTAFAQKAGTTITFDANNATGLYTKAAYGSLIAEQPFGYLKHNISHVQIVASNDGILQDETKLYGDVANNMLFDTTKLTIENSSNAKKIDGYYNSYIVIAAPKGYRFTYYNFDIDSKNSYNGAELCQITYTDGEANSVGASATINTSNTSQTYANAIGDNTNLLYFRLKTNSYGAKITLNSIKLTYIIDQPFATQLPASDSTTAVNTGIIDLGEFGNNGMGDYTWGSTHYQANSGKGYWSFKKADISDKQTATIYQGSTAITPDVVTVDGGQYYVAASAGDYYIEAPQKFRIIGATLNFLRGEDKTTPAQTTTDKTLVSEITSGAEYVLSDGNGNYLNLSGSSIVNGSDAATATKWTITESGDGYTIQSGGYYLHLKTNTVIVWTSYTLETNTTSSTDWAYSKENGFSTKGGSTTYYISLSSNSWGANSSTSSLAKPYTVETKTTPETTLSANFTAKAFSRDDSSSEDKVLDGDGSSYSVDLTDFNNDAIHFQISDLADGQTAYYNVNLQLMPLNPELQNLSVASQVDNDMFKNTTSFTPTNYVFNNGEAMTIVVPSTYEESNTTVKFLDAYNEEGTAEYNNGTNGYSNYFLVKSDADDGVGDAVNLNAGAKPMPDARTSTTQAGTKKLYFTNINDIYNANFGTVETGPSNLIDNEFKKTEAGYNDAIISVAEDESAATSSTYYVYSADMPTYNILPSGIDSKHIDFRYYTLNLQCIKQKEEPDVTITPIYTKTLKSQNNKNTGIASDGSTLNSNVTFFGATVKAKLADGQTGTPIGYLTSQQVVDGIKEAVKNSGINIYKDGDELRGMLYADLTSLSRTDNEAYTADFHKTTADNCLYFMYEGFNQANLDNVVVKTKSGNFESASNVKLYDQQPFYSPYDFNTAQYAVSYDRKGTVKDANGNKDKVKNMAVVLPFDVNLNGEGKLKTASDVTDNSVTYRNITGSGVVEGTVNGQPRTYGVVAEPVTANVAEANKPYYVETTSDGFSYNILGAQFRKSGTIENNVVTMDELTNSTEGTWQPTGTYAGITPDKAKGLWYFSQNLFWNSEKLENFSVVNVRPFRAYFTTSDNTNAKSARVVYSLDDITTGIGSVTAGVSKALDITVGNGQINVTANAATTLQIHTLAGQIVAKGRLCQGESRSVSVPQGIYIVNNVKVVVK